MAARTSAWLVWALLAGSVVFWGLRLGVAPQGLPDQVRTVGADQSSRGDILRLFANPSDLGATAPVEQAAAASRLKLQGVVAGGTGSGWAMLSVDGLPTRMIPVGGAVTSDWVVLSVSPQLVEIGPPGGPVAARLDLPLPAAPVTGVLGAPVAAANSVAPRAAPGTPGVDGQGGGMPAQPPQPPTVVLGDGGVPMQPSGDAPPPVAPR
jgi:general secretion pathway protein C